MEWTSRAEEAGSAPAPGPSGTLEGFETTVAAFGDVGVDPTSVPSLREEVTADDVEPMAELEPTVTDEASAAEAEAEAEPLVDTDLGLEAAPPAPPARGAPFVPKRPAAPAAPAARSGSSGGRPPLPQFEPRRPEPQQAAPAPPGSPPPRPPNAKPPLSVPPPQL